MFSSSVRRVALTAPPTPIASSFTSVPRATASQTLSYKSHQRRLSSSKPSSPAGRSKGLESQGVHDAPAKEKDSKSKAKEVAANSTVKGRDESILHLPSVPSTQHIPALQISASAFFSLHRPISLTNSFPKAVTDEAFAAIFTSRVKSNKSLTTEVISTISGALQNIDSVTGKLEMVRQSRPQETIWNEETDDIRAGITADSFKKSEARHLDGPPDHFVNVLSNRYQPFKPPPPPEPVNTLESLAAGAEIVDAQEPQHRTYTAVLTIEESTDANGDVTWSTHTTPLVAEEPPTTPTKFLERMQIRQERYNEQIAEKKEMLLISVKRQRKLKMKKHKYKKLMRRTRNLRRRLDRN